MAYLVRFEAKVAIWIAGDVSQDYFDVMQWLNDKTEIDAYLFKVETIRIDESRPDPYKDCWPQPLLALGTLGRRREAQSTSTGLVGACTT